ncbi:MAG: hypothetical protein H7Y04_09515, partial [Verrucomicrobia bacterium]|nr:hypothetical protein [Cytophagales bacterium]
MEENVILEQLRGILLENDRQEQEQLRAELRTLSQQLQTSDLENKRLTEQKINNAIESLTGDNADIILNAIENK